MMNRYARMLSQTPQSLPVPGENMVRNQAGGYVFQADAWQRLERFLVLGSETNTYYTSESEVAVQNIDNLLACIREDGPRVVSEICSQRSRAFKQSACIYALAMCFVRGDAATRRAVAFRAADVLWTASQLFEFISIVRNAGERSFSRSLRGLVSNWYSRFSVDGLAHQMVKYRTRNNYSHRDIIRLAHPVPATEGHNRLFRWVLRDEFSQELPDVARGFSLLRDMSERMSREDVAATVARYDLPREAVPTKALDNDLVWAALFAKMPVIAALRNLNKMTAVGLFNHEPNIFLSALSEKLSPDNLLRGSISPLSILMALLVYQSGRGVRGGLSWNPNQKVLSILEKAFMDAYETIERTDKAVLIAVDTSGSMRGAAAATGVSAAIAVASLATVLARTYSIATIVFFDTEVKRVTRLENYSGAMGIGEVISEATRSIGGGTDLSAPIRFMHDEDRRYDAIITLTDMETWAGRRHVYQAVRDYRLHRNPNLVGVNVMTAATKTTVASNASPLDFEVVGFSADVPSAIRYMIG